MNYSEIISRLIALGLSPLPVAPYQDPNDTAHPFHKYLHQSKKVSDAWDNSTTYEPVLEPDGTLKPKFTGKNPSFLKPNGFPKTIEHKNYSANLPTHAELLEWFANSKNGIGCLGSNRYRWLDLDRKHFESQDAYDRGLDSICSIEIRAKGWQEITQSGGYRLLVDCGEGVDFTNFALTEGGDHVGELLGSGRFAVLAPSVGVSGNPYVNLSYGDPIPLSELNIFTTSPKKAAAVIKPSVIRTVSSDAIELFSCTTPDSQSILTGNLKSDDRSADVAKAAKELYGWENWLNANGINYSGSADNLINDCGDALGIDGDRIERIKKSIDSTSCLPACVIRGGDESAQKRVKKLQSRTSSSSTKSSSSKDEKRPKLPPVSDVVDDLVEKYRVQLAWNVKHQEWYRYGAEKDGVWQQVRSEFVTQIVTAYLKTTGAGFNLGYVHSVLGLLRAELADEKWDARDHLLPFINGVLNLKTMKLEAHSSGYKLTWCLPYAYEIDATCEPIKDWLLESCEGNHDRVQMLRAALRAIVLGRSDLEKFVELLGAGGTGKSTFSRLAIALVGLENTFSTSLASLEGSPYETSAIQSKRLILINDAERWSKPVPILKAITGNDFIRTEEKFKQRDSGGMIVKAFVLITANEASTASSDYTSGLGRRKLTIPFTNKVAPNKRRDLLSISRTGISGEFAPYMAGLLNWVLAMSESDMKRYLLQPSESCPSLQKWIAESILENNPIAAWLDAHCIIDATAKTQIGIAEEISISTTNDGATKTRRIFKNSENWLYANYAQFCRDTGIQRISAKRFSTLLLDLLQNQLHITSTKGRDRTGAFLEGIRLRLPSDPENYPITGAKIHIVTDAVTDCDATVTAGTLDGDGCDGCDGLNQVISESANNLKNVDDHLQKIENNPLRLPKNPSHPSHPSPEPILAITQPITSNNRSVTILDIGRVVTDPRTGYEGELQKFEVNGEGKTVAKFGNQVALPEFLHIVT